MQIVIAPRATAILYNLLVSRADQRTWLLPANICPIVPITFLKARIPFKFVDISAKSFHMDLVQAEDHLKHAECGGILYAHTYGELFTPSDFFAFIKSRYPDVFLIDDRCLCVPDLNPDLPRIADVTLYSTGHGKFVDLHSGGYVFMNDNVPYRSTNLPFSSIDRNHIDKSYKEAINLRRAFVYKDNNWLETDADLPTWLDYKQDIYVGMKLSMQHRADLNAIYMSHLPTEIQLPQSYQNWRFNIRIKNKTRVLDAIFKAGLFASSHYASLSEVMATGRAFRAETLASKVINLFNDNHFTVSQAERICKIVLDNIP